jgi:TonB family protein
MYRSTKYENPQDIEFKIPWDKITAKSWAMALTSLGVILMFLSFFGVGEPERIQLTERPNIVLLNFGEGDGTGKRKGNLQKEGKTNRAKNVKTNLEDAKRSSKTKQKRNPSTATIEESNNITAVEKIETKKTELPKPGGNDNENIGKSDAPSDDLFARGLGDVGSGTGAGTGIGDIDWGGGGNRIVLNKPLPKYPDGVRASSKMIMQIKVLPDGTVSNVISKKKGDPRLEIATVEALKKWRFNPIDSNVIMIGEVPISFVVR